MKKLLLLSLLTILFSNIANADILVQNKDPKTWHVAIRHPVSTVTTEIPPRGNMVLSEGALSVQLRDANGNPAGASVDVTDGDRLTLKNGKIVRTPASTVSEN